MTDYDVYKAWIGMYAHFSGNGYDFVKNEGRTKAKFKTFLQRNDSKIFKAAKFKDAREFVSYFLAFISINRGKLPHITDILEFKAQNKKQYNGWVSKIGALSETFKRDLNKLIEYNYRDIFLVGINKPIALQLYESGTITVESLILINECTDIFRVWDSTITPDFIWKQQHTFLNAYAKFISINKEQIEEHFSEFKTYMLSKGTPKNEQ